MEEELLTPPAPGPFFRFADEAAWLTAARAAGFIDADDQLVTVTHDYAIDVVGTITVGGEWDEEGNELVAPTTLNGWHVNYVGELPDGWEAFEVTPSNPYRVFA